MPSEHRTTINIGPQNSEVWLFITLCIAIGAIVVAIAYAKGREADVETAKAQYHATAKP